jgi:Flp pilus assembly protein TadD
LLYHLALLQTLSGNFEGALQTFGSFSHDNAPPPELSIGVGLAGLRTSKLPKDLEPQERQLYADVGTAALHFLAGENVKAEQEFGDLSKKYPDVANLHYLLGYLLFSIDPDQAAVEFRQELQVSPSNAVAQVMLAWYLLLRNQFAEALPLAEHAANVSPNSPSAQLVLGRALVDTGDLNGGLEHLQTALTLDPSNIEVHLALVHAYSLAGRKADAARERLQSLEMTKSEGTSLAHN